VLPGWLTPRDHPWLRVLTEEIDALVGRSMEVVEAELGDRVARRLERPSTPGLAAARHTLLAAYTTEVVAPAPPPALRRAVFESVATRPRREREDALATTAASLGVTPDELRAALFADRPGARRLVPLPAPIDPQALAERTNLVMAQSLLARSEVVSISAGEHMRSVYRMAKLRRLICAAQVDAKGAAVVHVSGPLALFHHTTKYGGALASFVPALLATPAWSLEARCVLDGRRLVFRADASLPLARTHALPRAHDSDVERRLDRDLRKLARGWTLTREADVVRVGDRLFFPDFTLVRGDRRVLVEVVGFYTREYLRKKLEALRSVELPIIVLIDEKLACDDGEITADVVIRYRKKPDAAAVVAAAERLVRAISGEREVRR
jgi:predicted nuclease of restriction endonuclease-like RecB superfamily